MTYRVQFKKTFGQSEWYDTLQFDDLDEALENAEFNAGEFIRTRVVYLDDIKAEFFVPSFLVNFYHPTISILEQIRSGFDIPIEVMKDECRKFIEEAYKK